MNTITITAPTEEEALDMYYASTRHLDITLSELEAK
jgi:hypothetical protein